MKDNNKIRRLSQKSQEATERTPLSSISLETSKKAFPHNDIREIVSSYDVFNEERNLSALYRLSFSFKTLFHNTNFNQTGSVSYADLNIKYTNNKLDQDAPRLPYEEVDDNNIVSVKFSKKVSEAIVKDNGWYGYISGETENCKFIKFEPNENRLALKNDTGMDNWKFLLTYPYKEDNTYKFKSGTVEVPLSKGLAITKSQKVKYNERDMIEFTTPINHGLVDGNIIRLYNATKSEDFIIYRLGNVSGTGRNNIFVIDILPTNDWVSPIQQVDDLKFKRLVNDEESTYYVRKVKQMVGVTGYTMFKESISRNIYGDRNHQLVYNDDLDLSSYSDNKGVPISELYLTAIKESDNNFWEPIRSGVQTKVDNNYNIRNITKTKGTSMETSITTGSTDFCLDIIDYNKLDVEEKILADVFHRTNTKNREDANCEEGYFYSPHHFIKIRDFSSEIEYGDPATVVGIPDWAEDNIDGDKMWRDIYTIGFIDTDGNGVDYPFLNGRHYIFQNNYINLMRQDPFNVYDLNAGTCYVIGPYGIINDSDEIDFYEC